VKNKPESSLIVSLPRRLTRCLQGRRQKNFQRWGDGKRLKNST